jgi:predicted DNA-binding transcriptional regulator AlpA
MTAERGDPASITPRGLNRARAASYVGVGVTLFDEMVKDGRMPKPFKINTRTIWDRHKLDEAFEALSDHDARDPWEEDAACSGSTP